jgi:hypothetical protein
MQMPNTPVRAAAEGMPTINRRVMFAGMAASLAASTIPAEPAEHPDADLLAFDKEMEAAHARMTRAMNAVNRADRKAEKAARPRPIYPGEWKRPELPDHLREMYNAAIENVRFGDIAKRNWKPEAIRAWDEAVKKEKTHVQATWDEYHAKHDEQSRLFGCEAKQDALDACLNDLWEIGRRIFATPANTFEGMAVKLRAGDWLELEDFGDENEAFVSIAADIKRLAQKSVS